MEEKKNYAAPVIKVIEIDNTEIIAGSDTTPDEIYPNLRD